MCECVLEPYNRTSVQPFYLNNDEDEDEDADEQLYIVQVHFILSMTGAVKFCILNILFLFLNYFQTLSSLYKHFNF